MFEPKNDIHQTKEQVSRQKSALRLNVKSIDRGNKIGSINDYTVTLESCTCRDYFVRRLPCKHMYRLAHELGVFTLNGRVENDPTATSEKEKRENRKKLIEKALSMPKSAQTLLWEITREEQLIVERAEYAEEIDILLQEEFIELKQPTEKELYKKVTLPQLRAVLPNVPKGKKAEIIEFLRVNAPEFEQSLIREFNATRCIAVLASQNEDARIAIQRKVTPYKGMDSREVHELVITVDVTKANTSDAVKIYKNF